MGGRWPQSLSRSPRSDCDRNLLVGQQVSELALAHRSIEEISLSEVAMSIAEIVGLLARLDAFGDHLHPERARHLEDGIDEQRTRRARRNVVHECFVDLETIEWEIAEP